MEDIVVHGIYGETNGIVANTITCLCGRTMATDEFREHIGQVANRLPRLVPMPKQEHMNLTEADVR